MRPATTHVAAIHTTSEHAAGKFSELSIAVARRYTRCTAQAATR